MALLPSNLSFSRQILPIIALLSVIGAAIYIVSDLPDREIAEPQKEPPKATGDLANADRVAGSGLVEPASEVIDIGSALSGLVTDVRVSPGDRVEKGQPLFLVDDRAARARLAEANAAIREARAAISEAQTARNTARQQLALYQGLDDPAAVSRSEVIRVEGEAAAAASRLELARARLNAAQAQAASAQTELGRLTVRAPIAGEILAVNIRPGEFVATQGAGNSQPFIQMGETNPLHVRVDIDENEAVRVKLGAPAIVSPRGAAQIQVEAAFVRAEPQVVPKRSLTNSASERVDVRVLQVIYALPRSEAAEAFRVGQQIDAFIPAVEPASAGNRRSIGVGPMKRPSLVLLTIGLSASLSACVAGPAPEIATPAPDLPQAFFFEPDATTNAGLDALLPSRDAAFTALSRAALANAPTLAEATARIEAARANATRAGAERLPQISADGNVTENRINPAQFGDAGAQGFIPRSQTSYGANLVASWDADIFGRLKAQERAALARIDAASASAAAVRIALIAEIAGSVNDWRVIEARTAALQSDVEAALQLARLAKTREEAGIAPGFDRVRAEAAASASRSRLAALESEKVRLIGRLVTLTGQTGGEVNAALRQAGSPLALGDAPATLPSQLLANRPDVAAAASQLAAADADLAATARSRFPRLTLSGVIGLLAFDPEDLFDDDSLVGTLAAGVAGPLLDFGRIEAEIDGAAANKKVAFQVYRGAVFQALGDAEAAYGLISTTDAEARLAIRERDQLQRAASLANDRYRAGLSSFLEVLEARRAADASGERAAAAIGRAQRARILLWQALGGDHGATAEPE